MATLREQIVSANAFAQYLRELHAAGMQIPRTGPEGKKASQLRRAGLELANSDWFVSSQPKNKITTDNGVTFQVVSPHGETIQYTYDGICEKFELI